MGMAENTAIFAASNKELVLSPEPVLVYFGYFTLCPRRALNVIQTSQSLPIILCHKIILFVTK